MNDSEAFSDWGRLAGASSMIDVLLRQEGVYDEQSIRDFRPLAGDSEPEWVRRLSLPDGWRILDIRPGQSDAVIRLAVAGPRLDGRFDATETVSVFSYTGCARFDEVVSNAACTLRDLGADQITSRVLRMPPMRCTMAVEADGVTTLGARRVWMRQSNYLAGSMQPNAGRLVVHSVMVDDAVRQRWAPEVNSLCEGIRKGFIDSLNTAGAPSV